MNNMKYKRSTVLPAILLIYLILMAIMGLKGVRSGETSILTYVLTIVVTLMLIIILHFFLKRREKLRDERLRDINNEQKQ